MDVMQGKLEEITEGAVDEKQTIIVSGNRLRNEVLRNLVSDMHVDNISLEEILNMVLDLDELIELGEMTNENWKEILNDAINNSKDNI